MRGSSARVGLRAVRGAELTAEVPIPDAELVGRALAGDRWAEDALYRRHARAILGLMARLAGNSDEVEDLAQDAFLCAFSQLHRLRDPAAFQAWLRRIAVDRVRRMIRRRRLQRALGLLPGRTEHGLASLAAPHTPPELRMGLARLDAALAALPTQLRIAWVLRHVEGLTLDEVAVACGCSRATGARRLAAAQRRLDTRGIAGETFWVG